MKPTWYQYLWSYFAEVELESCTSNYNKQLQVVLKKGRYQLCTENAVYSYADKYDNYTESFRQVDLNHPDPKNVLLLGFGLGSIPYMLEKKFNKNWKYTGVEIDDAVIYLASKYVLPELQSDITMIQADAAIFLQVNNEKFDLICIDIFIDDLIPELFLKADFLSQISRACKSTGMVLFNHLAHRPKDQKKASEYYDQVFLKVFPQGAKLQVKNNWMLINDRALIVSPST